MKRYINSRTNGQVETIDELDSKDFNKRSDFYKECRRLLGEYSLAFHGEVYLSQRCDKSWNKNI